MRSMTQKRRWLLAGMASCIVVLAASCTDLTAVRDWSKMSLEATQYNEIVTTYTNTPERLKKYDPAKPWDNMIADRKNQGEALKQILSLVSDYMAALATLSADGIVDYSKDVDSLKTSIGNLNAKISQDTLGAVGSLVKEILGAVVKAYQAKQVADIVEKANDPLQVILRADLRQIVDRDFRSDLANEKDLLTRYYKSFWQKDMTSAAAKEALGEGRTCPAAKEALEEWKEERLEQNAKRVKALDAYLKVLDAVASGHQKLYDNRNKLDAKTLIKDLYSLVEEMQKQITILVKS